MTPKDIIAEGTEALDKKTAEYYNVVENYYLGQQILQFLAPEVRAAVGNRLTALHVDWPRLVIRSVEERTRVEDFRLANQETFADAATIWQRSNMDEESVLAHQDAYLFGRSFCSVWTRGGRATMRCESPKQVWAEHDPSDMTIRYALKRWFDRDRGYMNLLTPDEIRKYRTSGKRDEGMDITNLPPDSWELTGPVVPNFTGRVPYFPLINRRSILNPYGDSELTDVIPLVDAINKLCTDLMVSAEFHAMPRRWATGVEVAEDENGQVVERFSVLKGRTWIAEDPEARIGSLPEADLSNLIAGVEMLQQQLMALSGIPPHYVDAAKGSLASADSIRASEASLVAKVRRAQVSFGGAWEDAMRYAIELEQGSLSSNAQGMEVRWADPENRTLAQVVDSAIKRQSLGVPQYQLWEDIGYSRAQIERMKKMQKEEQDAKREQAELIAQRQPGGPGGRPAVPGAAHQDQAA
jgi:hypothetical protein